VGGKIKSVTTGLQEFSFKLSTYKETDLNIIVDLFNLDDNPDYRKTYKHDNHGRIKKQIFDVDIRGRIWSYI